MVDHYKKCTQSPQTPASKDFCHWLMENTSTEFMEANVNLAVSCVQGQTIVGYLGNTGVETWSGKLRSFAPHIGTDGVYVELEYFVGGADPQEAEDFLQITVIPDDEVPE
jgi:hypothetical protein